LKYGDLPQPQCMTRQRSCRGVIALDKHDNAASSIVCRKVLRGSLDVGLCNQYARSYHQSGTAHALRDGLFALRVAGGFSKEPRESEVAMGFHPPLNPHPVKGGEIFPSPLAGEGQGEGGAGACTGHRTGVKSTSGDNLSKIHIKLIFGGPGMVQSLR